MTAEQQVMKQHPEAYWAGVQGSFRIWKSTPQRGSCGLLCIGTGKTLDDAWDDALRRIKAGGKA
jgi:hypothetical protein